MLLQMTSLRKWLGTPNTREWFLPNMIYYMLLEITSLRKWLSTLNIREWFLPSISSYMLLQLSGTENGLVHWPQGNGFSPLWVLILPFQNNRYRKWLGTLSIMECMSSYMHLQSISYRKWLGTLITIKGFPPSVSSSMQVIQRSIEVLILQSNHFLVINVTSHILELTLQGKPFIVTSAASHFLCLVVWRCIYELILEGNRSLVGSAPSNFL